MKKKISIKKKTFLVLFITFGIIIFFVLGSQMLLKDIIYEKNQKKHILKYTELLLKNELVNLKEIANNNAVCILNLKNEKVEEYNINMNGCGLKESNSQVNKYIKEFKESKKGYQNVTFFDKSISLKANLILIQKGDEYIFLYLPLNNIGMSSYSFYEHIIYISIIILGLSFPLSSFISKAINAPIYRASKKMKLLSEGKYDITFDQCGIIEFDELSEAFNNALKDLSKIDDFRRGIMENVSHDLKTPLTMIKAYSEMIKDISYKDKKKTAEYLDIIISETDRLNIIVNDILDISKLQLEPESINLSKYDLSLEINNIISKYAIIKETENFIFSLEMPVRAMVTADKKKINQVIYNLLNNSINYTGKDKRITIKVTDKKKKYLVEIIDTGRGIEEKDIPQVWNKYYKNNATHKRNYIGSGIGLAIVKQLLELHKFNYGVNSTKNKGTTFYFEINK